MCQQAQCAKDLFIEGFNCAQSVAGAFSSETGVDVKILLRAASGFGGGVAGMKEVCGAVSGMVMAAGLVWGFDEAVSAEEKDTLKTRLQELVKEFSGESGCIRCADLLNQKDADIPQRAYCAELV
ncbi:MAG: C-GCAxxG-C-C family protein [Oscillospiraceae bacterium]|jgi:C_GCAxxG_C_C family probable redox protein|nr:C-GCAxxG-C-C family protein [Oscillospiraceae bacterium]